jgi:diguanylate cyclase (GGDEF)-like protein
MARHRNIGQKLLLAIGLPALVVAIAGVVTLWLRADGAVRQSTRDEATAMADLVSNAFTLAETGGSDAHRSVTVMMRSQWKTFAHADRLRILDVHGVVRWSREAEEQGRLLPDAKPIPSGGTESLRQTDKFVEMTRPLGGLACAGCHADNPMAIGTLQLRTKQPRLLDEVNGAFRLGLFGLLVFSLVLGLATALSLHFFLRQPLKKLAGAMKRAEAGDFLVRADARRDDELGQLALAFNQMLARITDMKAQEIDTNRDLEQAQKELALKKELELTNAKIASRLNELQTVYDVARSLTSTLELPELLGRITQQVGERLKIPQFSIMLLNADRNLEVKGAYPAGQGTEGMVFALGQGACGRAADTLRSVYIPDLAQDGGIYERRNDGDVKRGSLLSVPMLHMGTLLGVLNYQRPDSASFSSEELELLSAVADQASVAVKNAMLHEETVTLSITDPLTGIPNRRHLFTRLEMELARANRFGTQLSVLMIDIDHFKQINDHSGHRAGDMVLRRVSDLMRGMVRKVDTLARYGGEEFMLALPQVSKTEAQEVAEKIRAAVQAVPFEEGARQPNGAITVSVGVSNLPADATELEALVDCSDAALYAAKRGGRNKVIPYAQGMELHPGRERGPHAARRARTGEFPITAVKQG